MEPNIFHAGGGVSFGREQDGAVTVYLAVPGENEGTWHYRQLVTLHPDTWASVMAFVSTYGEDRVAWQAARDFHAGVIDIMRSTSPR